jgi:site-specific DNA-methyltransferase (adenine-specific)
MIIQGDCIELLKDLDDDSVDSIATDSPYGLGKPPDIMDVLHAWLAEQQYHAKGGGFMGKSWDAFVPGPEVWRECLRVLKPGGHLLSFFGTRTYDVGTMAIRIAGFEIRDQLAWVYGSGFPKSTDISKRIDKEAGAERDVVGQGPNAARRPNPIKSGTTFSDDACVWGMGDPITAPATPEAKQWQGWGSALKPAQEPICLARKPLEKGLTLAQNVLMWGTGGINVDATRVEGVPPSVPQPDFTSVSKRATSLDANKRNGEMSQATGRWPANLVHDGGDEVLALFPETKSGARNGKRSSNSGGIGTFHERERDTGKQFASDQVSAARFFKQTSFAESELDDYAAARFRYCPKASKKERDHGLDSMPVTPGGERAGGRKEGSAGLSPLAGTRSPGRNVHPTVKPIALMRWLVRMVTMPGGTVLDPFMGSGSTGIAAKLEGFEFIGMDISEEYCELARARIEAAE